MRWVEMLIGTLLRQAVLALVLGVLVYGYALIISTAMPWGYADPVHGVADDRGVLLPAAVPASVLVDGRAHAHHPDARRRGELADAGAGRRTCCPRSRRPGSGRWGARKAEPLIQRGRRRRGDAAVAATASPRAGPGARSGGRRDAVGRPGRPRRWTPTSRAARRRGRQVSGAARRVTRRRSTWAGRRPAAVAARRARGRGRRVGAVGRPGGRARSRRLRRVRWRLGWRRLVRRTVRRRLGASRRRPPAARGARRLRRLRRSGGSRSGGSGGPAVRAGRGPVGREAPVPAGRGSAGRGGSRRSAAGAARSAARRAAASSAATPDGGSSAAADPAAAACRRLLRLLRPARSEPPPLRGRLPRGRAAVPFWLNPSNPDKD